MASVKAALEKASSQAPLSSSDSIRIILRDGIYALTAPLSVTSLNSPLFIEAASGEHPVLSGAIEITNWTKISNIVTDLPSAARGNVWVAQAPVQSGRVLELRQLWVNGARAIRSREPNNDQLFRLVAWNKTNRIATIPSSALKGIDKADGLEMIIDQVWEIAILHVKNIERIGPNALITFKEPESTLEFQHPWPPVTVNAKYQAPFFLANAIQFLDEPGEWYEDITAGKIYYWPRKNEDMTQTIVYAPQTETLLQINGSHQNPVNRLQFKGITFAYTTWLRPSRQGHVPLQAGMFLLNARKLSSKGTPYHPGLDNLAWIGRPPAAVSIINASHISFEDCVFEHLASAGIDLVNETHDDIIEGCTFNDIGGNAIQVGKFSDPNIETHVPYDPSDSNEVCTGERIENNIIHHCATEDWGCVGIAVGYARDISIKHNEVFDLPYTGISLGWGWTKMTNAMSNNSVFANRIHHIGQRLGDLGGIYTLSAQPGTVVAENYISDIEPSPYVPNPLHWFYIYLDEGSSCITVRDNWCPAGKFLKNANGPGNIWTNNGPEVSESIKDAAGLEPAFKSRLH